MLYKYSEPSLHRQHLFPKTLPLKWIYCYREYLKNKLICQKDLVLLYFLIEHMFWVFIRIALLRRAARTILKTDFRTPSAGMFKELGWLSVERRLKYNKAVLTYKALNNLTPAYISSMLKPVSQTHCLNLRSSVNGTLYVPKSRTTLYNGAFSFSASKLWNSLPQPVRNCDTLNAFKKSLKTVV